VSARPVQRELLRVDDPGNISQNHGKKYENGSHGGSLDYQEQPRAYPDIQQRNCGHDYQAGDLEAKLPGRRGNVGDASRGEKLHKILREASEQERPGTYHHQQRDPAGHEADCDRCARCGLALEYPVLGADLVRLALACGDRQRARDVAAAVAGMADANEVPSLTGAALRCRGLADDDPAALVAAAAAYARSPRPLEQALAAEEAGAAFARHGQADRARPLLEQATAIYQRLGAARDLARAEAVLREAGIRRGRRGPRSRPRAGWSSLTPTERTITRLVAEGLSNPQIGERLYVSRRTVQTHIAHVFAKLDLSSRAQLATEVTLRRSQ
jgi:DNA-binding CsgD family transcriptional regulator